MRRTTRRALPMVTLALVLATGCKKGGDNVPEKQDPAACDEGTDEKACTAAIDRAFEAKDYEQALKLAKTACCIGGHDCARRIGAACAVLGALYLEGSGTTKDLPTSRAALDMACLLRHYESCYRLATLLDGKTFDEDWTEWGRLMALACERGELGTACEAIGRKLAGAGDAEARTHARRALDKGCALGTKGACDLLAALDKPDPKCAADCKSIGYCKLEGGSCVVRDAQDCRQSDNCRISGACSTKEKRNDDLTLFLVCVAVTDDDCKNSEACKKDGNCKAADGFCTNPADPETLKYRADRVKNVRDLAFKITKVCEATKAKTLRIFKQDGFPDPAASWAEMEGLNRELMGVVLDFRRRMLAQYDVILGLLDNDKDLLGVACYDALKAGATKGKDGCLFNGAKRDAKWLKAVAKAECDR